MLTISLLAGNIAETATNDLRLRTDWTRGPSLSAAELEAVTNLARVCGLEAVAEVSTYSMHLGGTTIQVAGDERFQGRSVFYRTVLIYPKSSPRLRQAQTPSLGDFWAESTKPRQEERTIVRIGDRELRIELLNGIKPAGADNILNAFASGKVKFGKENLERTLPDVVLAKRIGVYGPEGKLWISFADSLTKFIFTFRNDEIMLFDKYQSYE